MCDFTDCEKWKELDCCQFRADIFLKPTCYRPLKSKTETVAEAPCSAELDAKLAGMKENYTELLMAVESKYPGETRHDTALRYIKEEGQAGSEESN